MSIDQNLCLNMLLRNCMLHCMPLDNFVQNHRRINTIARTRQQTFTLHQTMLQEDKTRRTSSPFPRQSTQLTTTIDKLIMMLWLIPAHNRRASANGIARLKQD